MELFHFYITCPWTHKAGLVLKKTGFIQEFFLFCLLFFFISGQVIWVVNHHPFTVSPSNVLETPDCYHDGRLLLLLERASCVCPHCLSLSHIRCFIVIWIHLHLTIAYRGRLSSFLLYFGFSSSQHSLTRRKFCKSIYKSIDLLFYPVNLLNLCNNSTIVTISLSFQYGEKWENW